MSGYGLRPFGKIDVMEKGGPKKELRGGGKANLAHRKKVERKLANVQKMLDEEMVATDLLMGDIASRQSDVRSWKKRVDALPESFEKIVLEGDVGEINKELRSLALDLIQKRSQLRLMRNEANGYEQTLQEMKESKKNDASVRDLVAKGDAPIKQK